MTERRLPLALGNTGTSSDADPDDIIQKGAGGLWYARGAGEIVLPGRYLLRAIRTSGTGATYTLNPLTTKFRVYGQGPGSGGGGAGATTGSQTAVGQCGCAGAFFDHIFTVVPGVFSFTYTVGLGGPGGVGVSAGSAGSANTTVTYNGVTVGGGRATAAASAGSGDAFFPKLITPQTVGTGVPIGSPNIGSRGGPGGIGFGLDLNHTAGGPGGDSVMAKGGDVATPSSPNGGPGTLGSGGAAAVSGPSDSAHTGGAGGDGILIIEEYS